MALVVTTPNASGNYSVTIPADSAPPFVVEAVRDDQTLVSTFAEAKPTTLNITPLTTLIAARLAPDGNPAKLKNNSSNVTPSQITAKVAEVQALIQPVKAALNDTTNPLTGSFSADGSGHDRLLDALSISIRPTGTGSNIEVAVRSASADPIKVSFTNSEASPARITTPIATADLAPTGVSQMLEALTNRMNACYAVPISTRVNNTTTSATAANITAPACRTLFLGDDPATFKSDGRVVSTLQSFGSIFTAVNSGIAFDRPVMEFLRNNPEKDIVFTYRSSNTPGEYTYGRLIARNVNNVLKLVGNGYDYTFSVLPHLQRRDFVNQSSSTYVSSGYDINIPNVQVSGAPLFSHAIVTTPSGNTLTFKPSGGRSSMVIVKPDNTLSGSGVIRLAGKFVSAGATGTPSDFDTSLVWANPAFSEDTLRQLPEQGNWKVEYFFAAPGRPSVVQTTRTISRAPTLAEAVAQPLADLTTSSRAALQSLTAASGAVGFGAPSALQPNIAQIAGPNDSDAWTVPTGAIVPSSVTIFGFGPRVSNGTGGFVNGPSFDDSTFVSPKARKATINCTRLGAADTHCDTSTGITQFAQGTTFNSIQLFAQTPRFLELSSMKATYYLRPR